MHLTLVVPTLNRYDLLIELLASVRAGTRVPDHIYIIDNGGNCPKIDGVEIVQPGCNIGVSASWNLGLRLSKDVAIVSNDDMCVRPDTVERIVSHGESYPIVCCNSGLPGIGQSWGFFLQHPDVAKKIGWYDESFWPAYYEDADYLWRLKLANIPYLVAIDVFADQPNGASSSTAKLSKELKSQFHRAFYKNERRYIRKWGGLPGFEKFRTPFGV
mgnify:FL=1